MPVQVGAKGRVVLPAAIRHALGLEEGSELLARLDGDAIVLEPRTAAVERLQALVAVAVADGQTSSTSSLPSAGPSRGANPGDERA